MPVISMKQPERFCIVTVNTEWMSGEYDKGNL